MSRKIVICGGTGLIGRNLTARLLKKGYSVTIVSRDSKSASNEFTRHENITFNSWSEIENAVENSKAVINLSGASVAGKRWSNSYKKILYNSRIETTKKCVEAICSASDKPEVFLCSSGVGIYGDKKDEVITEGSTLGNDFLANLCKDWENEAAKAEECGVRTVMMRTGIVLDKNEGALPELLKPIKMFAGGYISGGNQWMSWIHITDMIEAIIFAVENNLKGVANYCTENPVTNKLITKELANKVHRPAFFSIPKFALKIILGEFADTLIGGQKVYPSKLSNAGFKFKYPTLQKALDDLIA